MSKSKYIYDDITSLKAKYLIGQALLALESEVDEEGNRVYLTHNKTLVFKYIKDNYGCDLDPKAFANSSKKEKNDIKISRDKYKTIYERIANFYKKVSRGNYSFEEKKPVLLKLKRLMS